MKIPVFETKAELFKFLHENRDRIIAHKRDQVKHADAMSGHCSLFIVTENAYKANQPITAPPEALKVKVVINTTNLMDSHDDVHMPGIWKKSLKENQANILHLQEHRMDFDKVIASGDDLKSYTEDMRWRDIGFKYEGTTQALIFESVIHKSRNPLMHEQYSKGYVRNHSVGMRYGDVVMCINNDNYGAEYEAWQKYYPFVANKDYAEERGYFFAVKSAKVIEGSAVLIGSNVATPTLDNNLKETTETMTAENSIIEEQPVEQKGIDYKYLKENFKI